MIYDYIIIGGGISGLYLFYKLKKKNKDFNILLFNYKTEIWTIFKEIYFDIILYETDKNFTSMKEILEKNNYIYYENLFINKKFLIN